MQDNTHFASFVRDILHSGVAHFVFLVRLSTYFRPRLPVFLLILFVFERIETLCVDRMFSYLFNGVL